MAPENLPSWFKHRQCKAEAHGDGMLKVSGPNLADAYLYARQDGDRWLGGLRFDPAGPDVATALAEEPNARAAWVTAFELYRQHVIV